MVLLINAGEDRRTRIQDRVIAFCSGYLSTVTRRVVRIERSLRIGDRARLRAL